MRVTPSDRTIALATPAPTRSGALSPEAVTASSSKSAATATPVKTLTELLAENPHKSPDELRRSSKYLPRPSWASRLWVRFVTDGGSGIERKRGLRSEAEIEDERRRVRACGNWGEMEPSDLFLDIYGSVLQTLNHDPRAGLVSPPLMGTTGTLPLTILSLIPDIMAHYASIIRRAQHEVLLFTNYWQPSDSQKTICNALRDLSKRLGEEGKGKKVVVKLVYDRGTIKQAIHHHSPVPPHLWHEIDLPSQAEIPNLEMQVVNFHRPLVGTFHSKFLVVDRRVGLLNSNNIQDRPNLEMMMHLEGPIVEALYDTGFISFGNKMVPMPPLIAQPPPPTPFLFQHANPWLGDIPLKRTPDAVQRMLSSGPESRMRGKLPERARMSGIVRTLIEMGMEEPPKPKEPTWFGELTENFSAEVSSRLNSRSNSRRGSLDAVHQSSSSGAGGPSLGAKSPQRGPPHKSMTEPPARTLASINSSMSQLDPTGAPRDLSPLHTPPESPGLGPTVAFANPAVKETHPVPSHPAEVTGVTFVDEPEEVDRLDAVEETVAPGENWTRASPPLVVAAPVDTEGDGTLGRLARMSKRLNAGVLSEPDATVADTDAIDQFMSHVLHTEHKPMPMVLVNRKPRGMFGHQDLRTPQNAAWLAGFKFAKKRVFIQTPTWNARPAVDAALDACRRGVEVILFLGLGFNDKGESIPFQGGTNEEVVKRMYKALHKTDSSRYLKAYWYVGKDQSRPLNAAIKQRNCHVKLAIFDDCVGIAGNGNQDTQSWYHSQEVNVLIDSAQVCADWIHALTHNQNTHIYGLIDTDGVWRDPQGRTWQELDRIKEAEARKEALKKAKKE